MTQYRMRPGLRRAWIPSLAAFLLVVLTVSLGNWQLRRADEKTQEQARRDAARAAPVVALAAWTAGLAGSPPSGQAAELDLRRVRLKGEFAHDRTVFLDNRSRKGVAGFHVFTPMRLESPGPDQPGQWVLVLRGWIARDPVDRNRLPTESLPAEPVTLEGLVQADLAQAMALGRTRPAEPHERIWTQISLDEFARWSGLPILPFFVRQTSGLGDGLARDWVEPGSGVSRHHGYAFQWYLLALLTTGLWIWFTFMRRPQAC